MCSLSFMPDAGGFHLLMNRDEKRTRPEGLPPELHSCGHHKALYPSEPNGGTWIGVNEKGLALALINWYSKPQFQGSPAFSRGEIIPQLLAGNSPENAEKLLRRLPHTRLNPFRLILVFAGDHSLHEFRSDAKTLEKLSFPWERHHWFSSGFDEPEAMRIRGMTVAESSCGESIGLLRSLHQSHQPEKGPFSICMHREDASTVSSTELIVENAVATLFYHVGAPCEEYPITKITLSLSN
jgi:Transport and Golgi organisation 2